MKLPKPLENTDLYRLDGRFYDLSEADGILTLQLRKSVIWDRCVVGIPTFLIIAAFIVGLGWSIAKLYPDLRDTFEGQMLLQSLIIPIPAMVVFLCHIASREIWCLDKERGESRWNNQKIADLPKIGSVKAWQRGAKFYVALHVPVKFEKGRNLKIGRFGFSRSERTWRQDAARIAAFLNVPLEIPPP